MTADAQGASAYFSRPERTLDPSLFTGNVLKAGVREYVLSHLARFFRAEDIEPAEWLHTWLAGSGVSYQWKASRGNGDLDVLLGIDVPRFLHANPDFASFSRKELAGLLNDRMSRLLWPLTAHAGIGSSEYEVTYYWNPEVSDDIRTIHPYAAWSLDSSRWDVPPDPDPPVSAFPEDWHYRAAQDASLVQELYRQWFQQLSDIEALPPANAARSTAEISYRRLTAQLRSVWDILHAGRRSAFTGGEGWADWHNFRWQAAKASGTARLLRDVIATDSQLQAEHETALYGAPVEPGEIALRRAAAAYSRRSQ